ncbi:MAG: hypothetical protein BWY63_01654 [Chloroflexi bacterium ADurb.Bin360]|nr:MAG: hypothetical protein BWY63_01654 [Chloroflexi bacterium ADurb.Bin360]
MIDAGACALACDIAGIAPGTSNVTNNITLSHRVRVFINILPQ